ncbi:cytidyltransferase [Lampropedia cohaerens]|uniref:Cytidyltransferase n=1 Tax=Lampropedia cohaerens TaxID=1610491 RepID=A0A0U1Q2Y4_9BURK|nr:bifunctional nicotinamide-nucleotide adenylyltransferase/Nudix hydroxylase [Lampropedia cohaerens]KKW69100.1 cytidyltransferase [Lampropedia cohaerens]
MPLPAFDAAVFIGRFQPFHNGHLAMVRHALAQARQVVIVLGSAHQCRTPKNPFTWQEREAMIRAALPPAVQGRVQFLPMRDFYDETRWVQAVQAGVDLLVDCGHGTSETVLRIALVGHFKDGSSAYLAQFPNWQLLNYPRQSETDATVVREACFAAPPPGDDSPAPAALLATLQAHVPPPVAQWLLQWRRQPEFAELRQEWQMLRDYKAAWACAPYPPVFVTVDALVQCQGQVLLVERGQRPGKGLYALPGGYLEQTETLWESCLRELREETALALPSSTWQQAWRTTRVFDHPDRSLRGRVITHVFHFDLGHGALPQVQGGDDAKTAQWVPIAQIGQMPERFFDDHFFILDVLLQLTHEVSATPQR